MRVIVIGLFLATALLGTAAEAQTVAGRIPAVWDAEYGVYTYGPLYWDVDVAPSSAASDEFSLYLYYNKRAAFMTTVVACRIAGKGFENYARSYSGDHFLSLTTGLRPGDECVLFLLGASDLEEELAYRMTVSERLTRPTPARNLATAETNRFSGYDRRPQAVSATLRKLAQAVANNR